MVEKTLAMLAPELFQRLEERDGSDDNLNRRKVIDDFFTEIEQKDEMAMGGLTPGYYFKLKEIVLSDVLPLYEKYAKQRDEIGLRQNKRNVLPFVLITIGVCEGLAAIFSKGRSLVPQIAIPTALAEGVLGAFVYYAVQSKDKWQIDSAKKRLIVSVKSLDQTLATSNQYALWKEVMGSEQLLKAEALEVLGKYDSPEEFWRDYIKVRKDDPTTAQEKEKTGVPRFESFLDLHAKGVYSDEARQLRYNQLFVFAHQEFTHKDPKGYVVTNLESRVQERPQIYRTQVESSVELSDKPSSRRKLGVVQNG